jgi:TatD DNase family protein
MEYFDTHAHLNFPDYDKDREDVVKNSLRRGVFMINVGTNIEDSRKVLEISKKHNGVYGAVGLHPLNIENEDFFLLFNEYQNLIKNEKVVAIGETGLDYKYVKNNSKIKENQKKVFTKHIFFANKFDLPIILHCRMAHQDVLEILKKETKRPKGTIHCFSGNLKEAEEYLSIGFYIGINGIIFKMNLEKVIKNIPLGKIVLETDCPFLSPLKSKKRNEPLFIKQIAKKVAKIKGIPIDEVAEITRKNAERLFKTKD